MRSSIALPEGTVAGERVRRGRDRFQAFRVPCDSLDAASGLVSGLTTTFGLGDASHLSWAARTGSGGSISETKNDGGERGAGSCILGIMRKTGTSGVLVLVARWFGGRHLGGLRFRIYRGLTSDIL